MSDGEDREPTLGEAIRVAVDGTARAMLDWLPAKIVKWDASKGRADCQILVKDVSEAEDGSREVASFPVVPGVPVLFAGAGGQRITFPISDGAGGKSATTGILIFAGRSIDKWLSGSGSEVDPELDHEHALGDAAFLPGLMTFGAPWQSIPTDQMTVGDDADGNGRIHFKSGEVDLGDGASKGVARKDDGAGGGTIAFAFAGGPPATLSIIYTPGDGSTPQNLAAGSGTLTIKEKITGGSNHIKAVD